MKASRKRRGDPLERTIGEALEPGVFIGFRDGSDFVDGLEAAKGKVTSLTRKGESARAVALLETFIAGCYEKSGEVDDSGGDFGGFVGELFSDWIRARQRARRDPIETAQLLLAWMEEDEYGYCYELERRAVEAFDRRGLAAFERIVDDRRAGAEDGSYECRRSVQMLKAVHVKRRDAAAYAALCEAEGDLAPADCETLAEVCLKRRKTEDALAWVDQGLALERKGPWPNRGAWRLPEMQRQILTKLGRRAEALASAWKEYRQVPAIHSYDELMKYVPTGERAEWHEKALAALEGTELSAKIELLVRTKEWERLGDVVESSGRRALMGLSHFTTEPAARGLRKRHPLLAAKLHVALGLRLLEAKKNKYYDVALNHFETARKIFLDQERRGTWQRLAAEIRGKHGRKYGFMPGFERLVEGRTAKAGPSFLERTRRRWNRKAGIGAKG